MNGMTNTGAMSRSGDLYRNINSIESKCAELISQIDDHLYVSDNRSLITRNNTGNEPIKGADTIFLCCHQSIVDYSFAQNTSSRKNFDVTKLPKLRIAKDLCDQMTKINQPLPDDLLNSLLKPTAGLSIKCAKTAQLALKPPLKKQVAFNLNVENDNELGSRNDGNVAVFECSHYSPTHGPNQHKCLANTKDAHAHPESVIDSQPHVHNGERPPENSTAADNLRAFLFGSLRKNGKLPKATKNTIVSVKTKRDLRKKKLKRWSEKLKMDQELVRGKSKRKVLFKMDKLIAEHAEAESETVTKSQSAPNIVEKLLQNEVLSQNQSRDYEDAKRKGRIQSSFETGAPSTQQSWDEVIEKKLATQLLKDRMKFCLKNSFMKEKKTSFS